MSRLSEAALLAASKSFDFQVRLFRLEINGSDFLTQIAHCHSLGRKGR
jgi:hypothetical protein